MGSALARILGDNHYQVLLYDTDKNTVDEINHFHTNVSKLPNWNVAFRSSGDYFNKSDIFF
ncbi:MAG: hypothetical protein ACLU5J_07635 [Christensenellales bacterium]